MVSTRPSSDTRRTDLLQWFDEISNKTPFSMTPASEDASFRRYFRISTELPVFGKTSLIAMDAPPAKEDCVAFIRVDALMRQKGVNAPEIYVQDSSQGFLLLEDFGSTTYQTALANGEDSDELYYDAFNALVLWQQDSAPDFLPHYDDALLRRELELFPEWYVTQYKRYSMSPNERKMLKTTFDQLIANVTMQPQVFVHRDYHIRNLMRVRHDNPGVLDFQDAVYGPVTYDLVSLLRDAYVDWSEERQLDWAARYWELARESGVPVPVRFDTFWRDFEWMGVQRHLKVAGIFARLAIRDGKKAYLNDMPRVIGYLRHAAGRYSEFFPLLKFLDALDGKKPQTGYTF
ncbi:MAG: phosphotransferase [Burkholderiales bacterium]|jgi:aminoglycoside/choline kinase family phosphotransferase|nr:phosphotransferase [Burkholderiales bacterium]